MIFAPTYPNLPRSSTTKLLKNPTSWLKKYLDEVQVQSFFVHELLDDQFSCKYHFRLVSEWGHTFTVDLLLQRPRIDTACCSIVSFSLE
jgi:hypothetical protein